MFKTIQLLLVTLVNVISDNGDEVPNGQNGDTEQAVPGKDDHQGPELGISVIFKFFNNKK